MSSHPAQPELLMPQAVLQRSAEHLADKYAGVFSPQTVERWCSSRTLRCAAPPRSTRT